MAPSNSDALAALLTHTQELLARAEPSLADWEGYGRLRDELFQRLQDRPPLTAKSDADSPALAGLYASVLENDRLLALRIRRHLSEISQDLMALADQRRIVNAYVTGTSAFHTYPRQTA